MDSILKSLILMMPVKSAQDSPILPIVLGKELVDWSMGILLLVEDGVIIIMILALFLDLAQQLQWHRKEMVFQALYMETK